MNGPRGRTLALLAGVGVVAVASCAVLCWERLYDAWLRRQIVGIWTCDSSAHPDADLHTMQIEPDGKLLDWWGTAAQPVEIEYSVEGDRLTVFDGETWRVEHTFELVGPDVLLLHMDHLGDPLTYERTDAVPDRGELRSAPKPLILPAAGSGRSSRRSRSLNRLRAVVPAQDVPPGTRPASEPLTPRR